MKNTLTELYHGQVKDLYSAENQQLEILREMHAAAENTELKNKFKEMLDSHQGHAKRLREVCENQHISPGGEKCEAMEGLVKEARHHMRETASGPVKDAVMIASANRFEHYEIAGYGVSKAFAQALELDQDVKLLETCIDEASDLDDELSKIATGGWFSAGVNEAAIA